MNNLIIICCFVLQAIVALECQEATQIYNFQLCESSGVTNLTAPDGYVVFIEELLIGVTPDGNCEDYDPDDHCIELASEVQQEPCTLKESCIYRVPKAEISKCGTDKFATYIYGQYRFIPASSSDPIQIGSDEHESVNVDQKAYGVLESKGFPVWQENVNFNLQFTSLNTSKAIRFYFIDLDIEDADFSDSVCKSSFIGLNDGVNSVKVCGMLLNQENYKYEFCLNNEHLTSSLSINYVTGGTDSFSSYYKGFKAYYEVIDKPEGLICMVSTTTIEAVTTKPTTSTTKLPTTTTKLPATTTMIPTTTTKLPTTTTKLPTTTTMIPTTTSSISQNGTVLTESILLNDWHFSIFEFRLDLSNRNIIGIDSNTFKKFKYLERLDLSYNRLEKLPNDVFQPLTRLKILRLDNNQINEIHRATFYGLGRLQKLYLHHNEISGFEFTAGVHSSVFEELHSLVYLDLSYNRLGFLTSWTFHGLKTLIRLGLESNGITNIFSSVFDELDMIRSVCFENNPMSVEPGVERVKSKICKGRHDCKVLHETSCCDDSECVIPY